MPSLKHLGASAQNMNQLECLAVAGYACKLYGHHEIEADEHLEGHEKHLIAWNGDEDTMVDRYDCRLYLRNLDEFDQFKRQKTMASSSSPRETMEKEAFEAELLEEEMCEEERWRDLDEQMEDEEDMHDKDEPIASGRRGAEIPFSYDYSGVAVASGTEGSASVESEAEAELPYQVPKTLKLPMGLTLAFIIERTALFVVEKGPQMEVVIRAKKKDNAGQVAFLEFDNPIHPFYKYICKQIREGKYMPTLTSSVAESKQEARKKPKNGARKGGEEVGDASTGESESDSDDGDYLHPSLMGAAKKGGDKEEAGPTFGPLPKPKPLPPSIDHEAPEHTDNVYLSLMKSLSGVIPKPVEGGVESRVIPNPHGAVSPERESDPVLVADYNQWHLAFYGKESPYLPLAPPIALPPPPELEQAISMAARYVAMNGPSAEERLVVYNDASCANFLLPTGRYYSCYQSHVRYHQWVLSQNYMAAFQQPQPPSTEDAPTSQQDRPPMPPDNRPTLSPGGSAALRQLGEGEDEEGIVGTAGDDATSSQRRKGAESVAPPAENLLKQERREKARQFMERILKDKRSSKCPAANDAMLEKEMAGPSSGAGKPQDSTSSLLKSNAISGLIVEKLEQVYNPSTTAAGPLPPSRHKVDQGESSRQDGRQHSHRRRSRSQSRERENKSERGHRRESHRAPSPSRHRRGFSRERKHKRREARHSRSPSTSPEAPRRRRCSRFYSNLHQ